MIKATIYEMNKEQLFKVNNEDFNWFDSHGSYKFMTYSKNRKIQNYNYF